MATLVWTSNGLLGRMFVPKVALRMRMSIDVVVCSSPGAAVVGCSAPPPHNVSVLSGTGVVRTRITRQHVAGGPTKPL